MSGNFTGPHRTREELEALDKGFNYDEARRLEREKTSWLRKLTCRYLWCAQCRVYDTAEGIGGKCIHCGKIHGWMTRAELREDCDRDAERGVIPMTRHVSNPYAVADRLHETNDALNKPRTL